jgi:hypothetical protein
VPDEDPIGDAIIDRFQRSTMPFDQPRGGAPGTAFLYNHLLESTANSDRVIELLITATALAQGEFGELGLRADMIEPRGAASSVLILPSFRDQWTHDTASGVAFMTTASLHAHGRRKPMPGQVMGLTSAFYVDSRPPWATSAL